MPACTPQEIHALFLDAFNRADVEALVSLYEPRAILPTGNRIAVGHKAIRETYHHILAGGRRMTLETRAVLESGEGLAVLHACWTIRREGLAKPGLSTEVVRRQRDGTWLFVIDEPRTPATQTRKCETVDKARRAGPRGLKSARDDLHKRLRR